MSARLLALLLVAMAVLFGCDRVASLVDGERDRASDPEPRDSEVPSRSLSVSSAVPAADPPLGSAVPGSGLDLPPQRTSVAPPAVPGPGSPLSFAPLVARADPSVATVKALMKGRVAGRERTLGEGLGTAFVYDARGFLLTNNHVVEQASEILVGFRDGRELPARLVGADARTDVAVLKVEAGDLPALPLGDSDKLLVGDWVVAIGNPFGLAHTVSAGILSAKGRTRDDVNGLDPAGYFDFLQTDASINPGNSGGPLLDLEGRVVGINAAIRQNANNIGFAIPINMVRQLLPMLVRDGRIRRSALGVIVAEVDRTQASRLGLTAAKGAWVKGIQREGPADRGGIAVDDVITAFDGQPIEGPDALRWYASISGVGRSVRVRIARGGKELDVQVELSELPE